MSEDFVPWSERSDDDSVDDLLGMLAEAVEAQAAPEEESGGTLVHDSSTDMAHDLLSNVFNARQESGVVGHFIMAAEVIGENGDPHLMVVTSDNLPEWVARGMIMAADDYIAGGILE